MKNRLFSHLRKLLIVPPVAIGVLVALWLFQSRGGAERKPEQEQVRVLRVMEVPQVDVVPRAIGYGRSQPGRIWQVVSEVQGRVVEVHPDLQPGAIIKKDAVVLRIDSTEYALAVDRLTAELNQATAKRDELAARAGNYEAQLALETRSLRLTTAELERRKKLQDRGAAVQSDIDSQQRDVLTQELKKLSVENAKNLLPAEQKSAAALIKVKEKALEQAQLDLNKTTLVAPFDCRIGAVDIEVAQFLAAGQKLFEGDGIDVAEVEAQLTPRQIRSLLSARLGDMQAMAAPEVTMQAMRSIFQLSAVVSYQVGALRVEWPAKFARVRESVDASTQTVGVVVAIEEPYRNAIPGVRHPPLTGMFCEVELRGVPRPGQLVVPRSSLRNGLVYVVDKENRLESRAVKVGLQQGHFAVVTAGLAPGERIVVSDPTPAIEGTLVKPVLDDSLRNRIIGKAEGEAEPQ